MVSAVPYQARGFTVLECAVDIALTAWPAAAAKQRRCHEGKQQPERRGLRNCLGHPFDRVPSLLGRVERNAEYVAGIIDAVSTRLGIGVGKQQVKVGSGVGGAAPQHRVLLEF